MRLSEKDRNSLIILAVLIAIIGLVVFCFHYTRLIPLKYIAIAFGVIMVVLMGVIAARYQKIYRIKPNFTSYIPLYNCLLVFDQPIAVALLVVVVITFVFGVACVFPADILANVIGVNQAARISDSMVFFFVLAVVVLFIVLGIGYSMVYADLRRMLFDVTGYKQPKLQLINYPLLFIPLFNVLGFCSVLTAISTLERFGYHEGDAVAEEELNEV